MTYRVGQRIVAVYMQSYTVIGNVTESRIRYGGVMQHTIMLDEPVEVFGRTADNLFIDEHDILSIAKGEKCV